VTEIERRGVLYVIVCAAGPARDVGKLVTLAQQHAWDVQIVATPSALDFIDVDSLEAQTGRPVRSRWRKPDQPRPPRADAIIVAPATYNTINKWAGGISDTYALGILAEAVGLRIPVVVSPFVNTALAERRPFKESIEILRDEGVRILLGPGEFTPHPAEGGDTGIPEHGWALAYDELEKVIARTRPGARTRPRAGS
jgi:phosphopantothenoylcysteine synthetase/decarboxylase